jgi:hypothetical protein
MRGFDSNQSRRWRVKSMRHIFARHVFARRKSMMDVIMIAIGVVFFALSIGYVYACERL